MIQRPSAAPAAASKPAPGLATELALVSAIAILGAALRLWHLWDIPSPTDELQGVRLGLAIARGETLPLTDFEPYIGAFWNYLLALAFFLVGPSEYVGRGVTLTIGTLTIPATYLLARELGGVRVALVAATLLATSSAHILASSHPAWSHAMAPLFLTLGLWQVARCMRLESGRALWAAGAWLGLALQIHLTMLATFPGIALALLIRRWRWLTSRWLYLAAATGLALVANILAFNVMTGFESARRASAVQASYARTKAPADALFVDNARRMGVAALRTVSGAIDIRESPQAFTQDPGIVATASLPILGLVLLLAQRHLLPLLTASSYIALLLVFNSKYEVIPNSRFLTPLAPIAFTCTGVALCWLASRMSFLRRAAPLVVVAITLALSAQSVNGLARRYEQMAASVHMTRAITATIDFVENRMADAPMVLVDRNLDRLWLDGGGEMYMALTWELYRRGVPHADLPSRVVPRTGDTDPCRRQWLIAARIDRDVETPQWVRSALQPDRGSLPTRFWTFRVTPREPTSNTLGPGEHVVLAYQPPVNGSARTVDRCTPGRMI